MTTKVVVFTVPLPPAMHVTHPRMCVSNLHASSLQTCISSSSLVFRALEPYAESRAVDPSSCTFCNRSPSLRDFQRNTDNRPAHHSAVLFLAFSAKLGALIGAGPNKIKPCVLVNCFENAFSKTEARSSYVTKRETQPEPLLFKRFKVLA